MKHFTFDHHWDAIKARLKQRYAQLTDDDLAFVEGKGEELLAIIRQKVGASVEDLRALLGELHDEAAEQWQHMKTKAGELADETAAQAATVCEQAQESFCTVCERGEDFVRQHPRKSLVGALCVGLVAGLLLRR